MAVSLDIRCHDPASVLKYEGSGMAGKTKKEKIRYQREKIYSAEEERSRSDDDDDDLLNGNDCFHRIYMAGSDVLLLGCFIIGSYYPKYYY